MGKLEVLVTGTAGFIGFHTAKKLLDEGNKVIGIDSMNDYYDVKLKEKRNDILLENKNYTFYKQDISDYEKIDDIMKKEKPQAIIHLAAQAGVRYSIENPLAYEKSNGLGNLVMLEMCKQHKIPSFVYASSSSVYGNSTKDAFKETDDTNNPISIYAATKKYNEMQAAAYSQLHGINTTGLRFFTVYGPWGRPDMALFKFVKGILLDEPIKLYNNGDMKRDFTYIDDLTNGIISALDNCKGNDIFNLSGGEPVNLLDCVKMIESELGIEAKKKFLPMQKGDIYRTSSNIDKAREMLGYEPKTDIKEGISIFCSWFLENQDWLLKLKDGKQ